MRVSLDSETKERGWNQTDEVEEGNGDCLRERIMNDSGASASARPSPCHPQGRLITTWPAITPLLYDLRWLPPTICKSGGV
ncbi:hypothetical protein Q7C36_021467 [Tachysurus vachellii]|uniref:Uncharacterized protein n=1 Tax=Tachysurus vachellii TaxID=175792 RepID=A0AA88IVE8_TACVA|nr:hypothetical protein Q7C36_021467 [Tachysurus vachellii]